MTDQSKLCGVYVVGEPGCINPSSGAWRHISVGIEELSKHFELTTMLPEVSSHSEEEGKHAKPSKRNECKRSHTHRLRGSLRDVKHLFQQTRVAYSVLRQIRKLSPDFVYYRASYLNPLPVLLRLVGIPCFIEANGLQFESRRNYYLSYSVGLSRLFERWVYRNASHVFFVGSYGAYWNLPLGNWTNVENGVEDSFLDAFPDQKKPSSGVFKLCFLGHLMQHHQPDVLVAGVNQVAQSIDLELHLIGSQLESVAKQFDKAVKVIQHGFLNREQLIPVLSQMDVGVIPGGPEYASFMKLFDYGAARMALVAPSVYHLKYWYPNELHFFKSGDADDLCRVMCDLALNRHRVPQSGNRLYVRLRRGFTWPRIFRRKAETIVKSLVQKQ